MAVPKSPGPKLARIPDPVIWLWCPGTACLSLHCAQELPQERSRVAPSVRSPMMPPENTLPWGSGDPKENEGKSGPRAPPGCSYAGNCHTHSPGPVPPLPVLPATILILSWLPVHTHSGQGPLPAPQVLPAALMQRRALSSATTALPLHRSAQPGRSQREKPWAPPLPRICQIQRGHRAPWDGCEGTGTPTVTRQGWGVAFLHHSHAGRDQLRAPSDPS